MLKHSTCQSDDQSSSIAKPSQQLWTAAACPAVDHDACPEGESSRRRPPLSHRCVVIMAAAGGIAVANLYYNQPMLPDIGRSFGVAADVIAVLPMSTQIGYALGLFLFVPLGDIVDRRQLVSALLVGIIVSLLALGLAPSLVWLDIASLTLGMMSAVAQVLVALAAQLSPPRHRGRVIGTLQAGGEAPCPGAIRSSDCRLASGSGFESEHSQVGFRPCWRRSQINAFRDRDGCLSRSGMGSAASPFAVVAI
jgi:Major Facilitator Superfamily